MKVIEVNKLINDIKNTDLSYMQQSDIVECLEHLINSQDTYDIDSQKK